MRCANCDHEKIGVKRVSHDTSETILRERKCANCGHIVFTLEVELPDSVVRYTRHGMRRLPAALRVLFS